MRFGMNRPCGKRAACAQSKNPQRTATGFTDSHPSDFGNTDAAQPAQQYSSRRRAPDGITVTP